MSVTSTLRKIVCSTAFGAVLVGTTLLAVRALASPPAPPARQIHTSFLTHPHTNNISRNHVIRMKMWYNDALFYEGSSAYGVNFPDGTSTISVHKGGRIRTELSLLDASGRVVSTDSRTYNNAFNGSTAWLAGQIWTPDRKATHHWANGFNQEYAGLMRLQWTVDSNFY